MPNHQEHHPNDDEPLKIKNNDLYHTESLCTLDSFNNTCTSFTDSVMTKINYNGCIMPTQVSPIKVLQFIIQELETKLKDCLPESEIIVTVLNDLLIIVYYAVIFCLCLAKIMSEKVVFLIFS